MLCLSGFELYSRWSAPVEKIPEKMLLKNRKRDPD